MSWADAYDSDGIYRILRNGTVCFVDTGARLLAVTAAHVLETYIADKKSTPEIVCQLGNITYEPEHHIISIDAGLDLATFEVSAVVVAGAGCSPARPTTWPPAPVKPGDVVICGGHPGAIRNERERSADLPFQWLLSSVSSSNEKIALCLDLENCHVPLASEPLTNLDLGGLSGGPIFKYIEPSPLERIELAGFVYQFQPTFGILFARPARFVDELGAIGAHT